MENTHLYSPHLKLAKKYWEKFLNKNDIAIDATSGNGFDSLFLANIVIKPINAKGSLFCFDIQKQAIKNTQILLKENLKKEHFKNIYLLNASHANFPKYVNLEVNLIVYNLGYLPKSDKTITTTAQNTLMSIKSGLKILAKKGAISIIAYPGHAEGEKEEIALIEYFTILDNKKFSILYHKWLNKAKAPSFFWIEKK